MSLEPKIIRGLLLGFLLAGIFWAAQGPPERKSDSPKIIVTEADVAHQAARWEKMRGRPPTSAELKSAMDGYVRNEILYQEALIKGMDREDPRVRMALIQKIQMMSGGQADAQSISEEELNSFFALRKEQYMAPATLSMKQVFFKQAEGAQKRAEAALNSLTENEPADTALSGLGDTTMLESLLTGITAEELEAKFGTDFTAGVLSMPPDEWAGPIQSGYGLHLVKIFDRLPGKVLELESVRDKVEYDLLYEIREASQEQGYQEIAVKYQVMISDGAEQMLRGAN